MLKAICIVSANDCSVAMAEHLGGNEAGFVEMMNKKAKELGMKDTTFKNCHGIDADGHVTSAYDIALMSKELLNKYPKVTEYTSIWMDTLRNGESQLVNTNKLLKTYEGATGLKTGSTSLALYNLAASATRNNLSLIAVVMRAPSPNDRVLNAKSLLDYGFANYEYISTSVKDKVVQNVPILKGLEKNVNLVYESTTGGIVNKSSSKKVTSEVQINENIEAPINKGDVLGKVNFYLEDKMIASSNLVAQNEVKKMNTFNMFEYVLDSWSNLNRKNLPSN